MTIHVQVTKNATAYRIWSNCTICCAVSWQFCKVCPTVHIIHSTVSSYSKLPALLNWLKPVNHGPFGQSILDFCPDQPGRNWMYQDLIAAKVLLSNMYTVVCPLHNSNKGLTLRSISCIGHRYFVLRTYPKCLPYQIKPKQNLQTP